MKSRKPKMLAVLLATSTLVLGACGGDDDGDSASGGDGEVLKVGTKYDQPLFGVNTPDGVEGFDADIARYIGDELGREVEFQEAVSANRETFLQNGTVDMVVATYTINDERDELIDFAGPYYIAGQDIMVMKGNPKKIKGIEDLDSADIKTCTVEGSTSLENLNEMAPDANVSTFDTYSKCADAMGQGRVDAVTTALPTGPICAARSTRSCRACTTTVRGSRSMRTRLGPWPPRRPSRPRSTTRAADHHRLRFRGGAYPAPPRAGPI